MRRDRVRHFKHLVADQKTGRRAAISALDEAVGYLTCNEAETERALLIRTAALVALGVCMRYPLGSNQELASKSVALARAIVAEVDGEHVTLE